MDLREAIEYIRNDEAYVMAQKAADEFDALRKAVNDALPFIDAVSQRCHHSCDPESCSAEGQRRAKRGRFIAAALRCALGSEKKGLPE